MYGETAQRLVQSALTSKRYEGELVDSVVRECWDLNRILTESVSEEVGNEGEEDVLRDYIVDVMMKRNKRCLIGYGWDRAAKLRASGPSKLEGLTVNEERYFHQYETLLNGVSLELDLDLGNESGHGETFVLVRNRELKNVVVEGEFSKVFLAGNGEGVLKRGDAERLSKSGEVNILHAK